MITVQDILNRPLFAGAAVAAGAQGLSRSVNWVHVGEIPDIGHYLRGGELVLSTGVGLSTPAQRRQYVDGLVEAGAAGLILELGTYWATMPEDLFPVANQHRFPIIAFAGPVRFLDLSQDINQLLISQHYRIMDQLETLSLGIRDALLNTLGPEQIIRRLSDATGCPVAYCPRDANDQPVVTPGAAARVPRRPLEAVATGPRRLNHDLIWQTVMVFHRPIADLMVASPGDHVDEFIYLAMDRTAAALAQDYIRVEGLDRVRRQEDWALLESLLYGASPTTYHGQRFRSRYHFTADKVYRIVVVEGRDHRPLQTWAATWPSSVAVATLPENDRIIGVVMGPPAFLEQRRGPVSQSVSGFSNLYRDPFRMSQALVEATDAVLAAHLMGSSSASYSEMGVWRWILATSQADLETLVVQPELHPILGRPDQEKLLTTLEALLTHIDSKQAASGRLAIRRQTLYARIRTLGDILGSDFLSPERRLSLQLAVTAYRYLHNPRQPS